MIITVVCLSNKSGRDKVQIYVEPPGGVLVLKKSIVKTQVHMTNLVMYVNVLHL